MPTQEATNKELRRAAKRGDVAEVRRLVTEQGADVKWQHPGQGNTALHLAAWADKADARAR